jgi:TATA-binding protein-associated factor Taf7
MPPQSPDEGEFNNGEVKEENDDDAFAAAIEQALQQGSDEDDDEDEEEEESGEEGVEGEDDGDEDGASDSGSGSGSASGSDDDEDDEEYSGAKKLLDDEIKQLEVAIAKKNEDIAKVTNVALKVCNSLGPFTSTLLGYSHSSFT